MTRRKGQSKQAVVELTRRTLDDLRQIEIYSVQEWGRKVADKYLDDISAALAIIPIFFDLSRTSVPGFTSIE